MHLNKQVPSGNDDPNNGSKKEKELEQMLRKTTRDNEQLKQ